VRDTSGPARRASGFPWVQLNGSGAHGADAVSPSSPYLPRVAISILTWNGWQDTLECVESVRRLDYPNYLTVVVDNGSWDDSAEQIKAWAKENLDPGQVLADYSRETALAGGDPETEQALDRAPCPARTVLIRTEENLGFMGGHSTALCIHVANRLRPLPSRLAFHVAYLPLCMRRIAGRLVAGQPHLARAIARGLLDAYRDIGGKWRLHDREAPGNDSG
jgi:cellulose synthase/poly-beta-1,6-N-acetylglucosamine synthase-like glycosyltransferase